MFTCLLIFLFEKQNYQERSSIHWFTSQMTTLSIVGLEQKPGIQSFIQVSHMTGKGSLSQPEWLCLWECFPLPFKMSKKQTEVVVRKECSHYRLHKSRKITQWCFKRVWWSCFTMLRLVLSLQHLHDEAKDLLYMDEAEHFGLTACGHCVCCCWIMISLFSLCWTPCLVNH